MLSRFVTKVRRLEPGKETVAFNLVSAAVASLLGSLWLTSTTLIGAGGPWELLVAQAILYSILFLAFAGLLSLLWESAVGLNEKLERLLCITTVGCIVFLVLMITRAFFLHI